MNVEFKGPAGKIEGLLEEPSGAPRAAVVFAHPHPLLGGGGTMHTKAVYQGAKGLVRIGCAVLRFNFRGVGLSVGTFDAGLGEREDFSAALDFMSARYPGVPLWAAGFSFGSWIALETGAVDPRVSVLIGIAPPWNRELGGRSGVDPVTYNWPNTLASEKPKFFVQGESDEVCAIQDMWAYYGKLHEPKELVVIDGADHLFHGKTSEVGEALEELLGDYEA
jgi:alpha/beta superfamily hydrolase